MASISGNVSAETPEVSEHPNNKFNWLKQARDSRGNPFVKARPSLTRESSTAELVSSRENSNSDFFQNSRLNLFDTAQAPKPEARDNYIIKVDIFIVLYHCSFILASYRGRQLILCLSIT